MVRRGTCNIVPHSLESAARIPDSQRQSYVPCEHQASGARRRAGCQPKGSRRGLPWLDSRQPFRQGRHAIIAPQLRTNSEESALSSDELSELERTRRRALWALASLHPGDSLAIGVLAILDDLEAQERGISASTQQPLELNEARHSVPVERHTSGIDKIGRASCRERVSSPV